MTKRKTSGTGRNRNYDRPARQPSTATGPNYLAQERDQEFVSEVRLIKAADLNPRSTRRPRP